MNENLKIYEAVRSVPENAKRKITGGRLNGKTDINPMWRIKALTETFGPCGTGWYVQVVSKEIHDGVDGVKVATVDLNLFYRLPDGEWSAPVFGTGGNMLVDKERNGLYTSDEAFKMAYTDALSVCCKMLGVGADVYWEADRTKYSPKETPKENTAVCDSCGKAIRPVRANGQEFSAWAVAKQSKDKYGKCLCWSCAKEEAGKRKAAAEGEVPPWETR